MQDKYLLKKISEEVQLLCNMNGFRKLTKLIVTVNYRSNVDEDNLLKQLHHMNKKTFGEWTEIQVLYDDIQEKTAILHTIEGVKSSY